MGWVLAIWNPATTGSKLSFPNDLLCLLHESNPLMVHSQIDGV